jgi:hypothetical protein
LIATICAALAGASVLSAPAFAQKTEKECQDEWRANRAANQAAKITEKDYVTKCRAGTTAAQPATPPAAPTTNTATSPPTTPAPKTTATPKSAPAPKAPPPPATAATGVGEFTTEALAKASCPADLVVWANLDSKIYHFSGNKNYGNTKDGAYMCEKVALAQGVRAAKNEKHP